MLGPDDSYGPVTTALPAGSKLNPQTREKEADHAVGQAGGFGDRVAAHARVRGRRPHPVVGGGAKDVQADRSRGGQPARAGLCGRRSLALVAEDLPYRGLELISARGLGISLSFVAGHRHEVKHIAMTRGVEAAIGF